MVFLPTIQFYANFKQGKRSSSLAFLLFPNTFAGALTAPRIFLSLSFPCTSATVGDCNTSKPGMCPSISLLSSRRPRKARPLTSVLLCRRRLFNWLDMVLTCSRLCRQGQVGGLEQGQGDLQRGRHEGLRRETQGRTWLFPLSSCVLDVAV
jgi:hypothetical protein